ncbi:MAG: hypothetical protein ACREX4_25380 [Gammaproteobacteria bacterium]
MKKLYARFVLWLIRPALELDAPKFTHSFDLLEPASERSAQQIAIAASEAARRAVSRNGV